MKKRKKNVHKKMRKKRIKFFYSSITIFINYFTTNGLYPLKCSNIFTMYLSTDPTSIADITVPTPTLPGDFIITRHVISDSATTVVSNPTFIFGNGCFVTNAIVCVTPSTDNGMRLGGRYVNNPSAINTILIAM